MKLSLYQSETDEFAIYPPERALEYLSLGLLGECGEIANQIKKSIRDDKGEITPQRIEKLADELGDVLWYTAQYATYHGLDLAEVSNGLRFEKIKWTYLCYEMIHTAWKTVYPTPNQQQMVVLDMIGWIGDGAWTLGLTLEELAERNITKLSNRRSRGVLGGSGDNR